MEYYSSRPLVSSSSDGSLLAVVNGGRDVSVWDTSSGRQVCKVTGQWSSVLSIAWSPNVNKSTGSRKKRKRGISDDTTPLLAIGLANEGLAVWDIDRNEEYVSMPNDGCGGVVSVSWAGRESLFLADGTKLVFHWSIGSDSLDRWKADKSSVSCVHTGGSHGDDVILTAGRSIKLWDTNNYSLIKRFTGHADNIISLLFVTPTHFLSVAENDRTISLWNSETGAGSSLVCESEVWSIHSNLVKEDKGKLKIVSVCQDGLIHLFTLESHNHTKVSNPYLPNATLQFVAEATSSKKTPTSLPVLSGHLSSTTGEVMVAHTSTIRPVFENIPFEQPKTRSCIIRSLPKGFLLSSEDEVSSRREETTSGSRNVSVVGPSTPRTVPWKKKSETGKKKDDDDDDGEVGDDENVPMSSRLESLSLEDSTHKTATTDSSTGKRPKPTAESLAVLVLQAVHSDDRKLLDEVIRIDNKRVVDSTVRRLSITVIVPFLRTLIDIIHVSPTKGSLMVWLRSILLNHTAYLLTVPHLLDCLSTFYQSMESKTTLFSKLAKIEGKLDLLLAQAQGGNEDSEELKLLTTPLTSLTAGEDEEEDTWEEDESSSDIFLSNNEEEEEDEEEEEEEEEEEDNEADQDEDKMDTR